MSGAGGAGGVRGNNDLEPVPAPVPEPLPRLSIKVPSSKIFTGDGEDLKLEASGRLYHPVQLYLRLHHGSQKTVGAGNY